MNYSRALPVGSSKVQNHHHLVHPFDAQIHFVLEGKSQISNVQVRRAPFQVCQLQPRQEETTLVQRATEFEPPWDADEHERQG